MITIEDYLLILRLLQIIFHISLEECLTISLLPTTFSSDLSQCEQIVSDLERSACVWPTDQLGKVETN